MLLGLLAAPLGVRLRVPCSRHRGRPAPCSPPPVSTRWRMPCSGPGRGHRRRPNPRPLRGADRAHHRARAPPADGRQWWVWPAPRLAPAPTSSGGTGTAAPPAAWHSRRVRGLPGRAVDHCLRVGQHHGVPGAGNRVTEASDDRARCAHQRLGRDAVVGPTDDPRRAGTAARKTDVGAIAPHLVHSPRHRRPRSRGTAASARRPPRAFVGCRAQPLRRHARPRRCRRIGRRSDEHQAPRHRCALAASTTTEQPSGHEDEVAPPAGPDEPLRLGLDSVRPDPHRGGQESRSPGACTTVAHSVRGG